MHDVSSLGKRPLDAAILLFLAYFLSGWLTNDLPVVLGIEHAGVTWYNTTIDPFQGHPTPGGRFTVALAATVYGPAYLGMFYGVLRQRKWAARLVLPVAGMVLGTTLVYMAESTGSATPPLNMPAFLLLNGSFAVGCGLMIYRFAVRAG